MKHLSPLILLPLLIASCYDPMTDEQHTRTAPQDLSCDSDSTTSLTITIHDEWDGIIELNY